MSAAKKLALLVSQPIGYNEKRKAEFKRLATKLMKELVKELDLEAGTYDIKWNAGGIAVSGEVWLFHDNVFIEFSQSALGPMFYYRKPKDRKNSVHPDMTVGRNHWLRYDQLIDMPSAARIIKINVCLPTKQNQSAEA
jgi:uncharacterized protein (DUF2164 family)